MKFKDLKNFTKWETERLEKHFPFPDKEKGIFARMTKIMEELGELCDSILSYFSLQRNTKEKRNKKDVEKELADTIIGLFILAEQMDIDIEKALEKKIEIIKSRKY